jgi:hypothetical protein
MTHDEIMKLKEAQNGIHAWDFCFSEGDTIKEKYESLYEMVRTLALHKNGAEAALVFSKKPAVSALTVSADFHSETEFVPHYKDVAEGVRYIALVERSCGNNGYNTGFKLYEDEAFPEDEVLVVNGDDKKLVKLFNYVF